MKHLKLLLFTLLLLCINQLYAQNNEPAFQKELEQWNHYEIVLSSTPIENGFIDVVLTAKVWNSDTSFTVTGFYDGNLNFKIRFMPTKPGKWQYKTSSNIAALNKREGSFNCVKADLKNNGMVRVSDTYHFKYSSGKNYYPFGTTVYAWTHMGLDIEKATLNSLKKSGFNKVRMCVFPKNYDYVKREPELYPFEIKEIKKDATGKQTFVWNFDRFNPAFFDHLEKRIDDLDKLGIEADLILFHPYDKGHWGFDAMPNDVNIRYLKYIIARLSSYKNVWWSLANEWDYIKSKTKSDWDLYAETISKNDPYKHLCSIHGSTATYYDYWKPEFSHVSIQDETPVQSPSSAGILRNIYHKPIISDEVGYEGNLKARWGRYSPEEMTYLIWNGIIGGTYVTHGECYTFNEKIDTIFWAEGGNFKGNSWERVAFLRKIVEACPGPISLSDIGRDNITATAGNGYYLVYFGKQVNESWLFNLPAKNSIYKKLTAGKKFKVDIIDTWEMTIQECPQIFETAKENDYRLYDKELKKIRLPLKPYMALRIRVLE